MLLPVRLAASQRNHQFDLLRILFAVMVLLSHAAELTDGNKSREILSRLTTSEFTFGALGVDGFFLLSGYLIVKSWVNRPNVWDFMKKRLLRLAPGYAVAAFVVFIVVGFAASGETYFFRLHLLRWETIRSTIFLYRPVSPSVFPGNPYPILNGSLWTILYEFRCYIVVAIWGMFGLFRKPRLWGAATVLLMVFPARYLPWSWMLYRFLGDPVRLLRFATVFFVGGSFFLFKDSIKFSPAGIWCSICGILAVRFTEPEHIEVAFVIFGGYLLFYFGSRPMMSLSWMSKVPDLSYGIYLYGWPVENYLIWKFHPSPWIVFIASAAICADLAWLSWTFIEGPALSLKGKRRNCFVNQPRT